MDCLARRDLKKISIIGKVSSNSVVIKLSKDPREDSMKFGVYVFF